MINGSPAELSLLAQRLVETDDHVEVEKLKSRLTRYFYGNTDFPITPMTDLDD
jgi:hypothetical protein